MKKPKNETCLAAELARCHPEITAYRCALVAAELCAIGRRYNRLAERLCGGEDVWGRYPEAGKRIERAERAKERVAQKAMELLRENCFRNAILNGSVGLCLLAQTNQPNGYTETTALL
jgi:hypothetical protein